MGLKIVIVNIKHDNLTTTECPTCGKFMIKVKTKMVRCLCAKIHLVRRKRMYSAKQMQDVQTVKKKLTLFGKRERSGISLCLWTF